MLPLLHLIVPTAKVQMDHWRSMPTVDNLRHLLAAQRSRLFFLARSAEGSPGPGLGSTCMRRFSDTATAACSSSGGTGTPSRSRPSLNRVLPNGILQRYASPCRKRRVASYSSASELSSSRNAISCEVPSCSRVKPCRCARSSSGTRSGAAATTKLFHTWRMPQQRVLPNAALYRAGWSYRH